MADNDIAVGEYTSGSGHFTDVPAGYQPGSPAVLLRVLPDRNIDGKPFPMKYQYKVILPVTHIWQAQAIVAILNSK